MKYLQIIDIFGLTPYFFVLGKKSFKTKVGGVFSLLVMAVFIILCYFLSRDMIEKNNPAVTQTIVSSSYYEETLNLGAGGINIVIAFRDRVNEKMVPFNESIFYPSFTKKVGNREIDLTLYPCDPIVDSTLNLTKEFGPGFPYCMNQPGNSFLFGAAEDEIYLELWPCDIQDPGAICATRDEGIDFFNRVEINIYYKKPSIIIGDYKNPVKYTWDYLAFSFFPGNIKNIGLFLSTISIITDDNAVSGQSKTEYLCKLDKYTFDVASSPSLLAVFYIQNSGDIITYERTYPKLANVIAQVIALLNIMLVVFRVVVGTFNEEVNYNNLSQSLFKLGYMKIEQGPNDDLEKGKEKPAEIEEAKLINQNSNLHEEKSQSSKEIAPKDVKIDKARNSKIYPSNYEELKEDEKSEINFFEWIKSKFVFSPKAVLLDQAKQEVCKELDLLTMLKKLQDIEKMKYILLTDEQRFLYDNLSKNEVSLLYKESNTTKKKYEFELKKEAYKTELSKETDLVSIVANMKQKENLSDVEKKLLKLYNKENP